MMGIDTQIRDRLRRMWAKRAWIASYHKLENHLHIDDALTRLFHKVGPSYDHMFTSLQLYREFIAPVRAAFHSGAKIYVLLVDDQKGVPDEKRETQNARALAGTKRSIINNIRMLSSAADAIRDASPPPPPPPPHKKQKGEDGLPKAVVVRDDEHQQQDETEDEASTRPLTTSISHTAAIQPYPDGCLFVDGGIKMSEEGDVEKIDIRRWQISRTLRTTFGDYVASKLQFEVWPDGKTLILDTNYDRPIFSPSAAGMPPGAEKPHGHGEPDISIFYWVNMFKEMPCVVYTTDTDIMPISISYLDSVGYSVKKEPNAPPLLWVYEREWHVDLRLLYTEILSATRLSARTNILSMILPKTDFFMKHWLCHNFGHAKIFDAVDATKKDWELFGKGSEVDDYNILKRFLFALYGKHIPGSMVQYEDVVVAVEGDGEGSRNINWVKVYNALKTNPKLPKKSNPPDDDMIQFAAKKLKWNLNYWSNFNIPTCSAAAAAA